MFDTYQQPTVCRVLWSVTCRNPLELGSVLPFQPFQDRLGYFIRPFLLDPMAAVQIDHLDIGHELLQVLGPRDRLAVAVDHEGGLFDDRVHVR